MQTYLTWRRPPKTSTGSVLRMNMFRCVLLFGVILLSLAVDAGAQIAETTTTTTIDAENTTPEVSIAEVTPLTIEEATSPAASTSTEKSNVVVESSLTISTTAATTASDSTQCPRGPCPTTTPMTAPVCASDQKVYDSQCHMNVASNCSLEVVDWEECRGRHPLCPSDCLDIQDPVCGEDGRIYPNKCVMHKRNCGRPISHKAIIFCVGSHRKSRTQGKCPDSCLELYRPVCGSDGQVYLNDCYLRKQNCRRKVSKVEMSECVTPSGPCPTNCIAIYDPVCGSDRRLYINQCSMLRDNCARPVKSMPLQFCVGDQLHRL